MTCKNCGRELEDGLAACPHCGSVLTGESNDIDPVNTIVKSEISAAVEEAAASTSHESEPSAEKDVSSESISENEAEDNDDVYFLKQTGEIVFVSSDGFIRTYFISDEAYFNRQ